MVLTTTIFLIVLAAVALATVMLIIFVIYTELKFNYVVRLKEVVNGRLLIRATKAKEIKDKDGTRWLKFKKHLKDRKPLPPSECIDIQQNWFRTVKAVDVYVLEGGNVRYAKDVYDDFTGYHPVTTDDRSALVNQIEKATAEAGKLNWNQIQMIVSITAVVIIVLFGYFTFQDFNESQVEISKQGVVMSANIKEAAEANADVLNGIQRIRADNPTTPPDAVTLGDEKVYK